MPRELLQNSGTSCSLTVDSVWTGCFAAGDAKLLDKTTKTLQKLWHHLLPAVNI